MGGISITSVLRGSESTATEIGVVLQVGSHQKVLPVTTSVSERVELAFVGSGGVGLVNL